MTSPIILPEYRRCEFQLTAFFPTSKPPFPKQQVETFAHALSACHNVEHFAEKVYRLYETHVLGRPRPEEYWVHDISIVKRYFLVQHEVLVVEIRHVPLDVDAEPEDPFFILVDRTIFGSSLSSSRKRSDDRVICSPISKARPALLYSNLATQAN